MKKGLKIGIACGVCGLLAASAVFNVLLAEKAGLINLNSVSGTIVDELPNCTQIHVEPGGSIDVPMYSQNGKDQIYNLFFRVYEGKYIEIQYQTRFSISDDLEVYFVFDTDEGDFATYTETTHWSFGGDHLYYKDWDYVVNQKLNISPIKEAWVRTVD